MTQSISLISQGLLKSKRTADNILLVTEPMHKLVASNQMVHKLEASTQVMHKLI